MSERVPPTHEITLEGIIRCLGQDVYEAMAKRAPDPLYVTWWPDEVTCLACQRARARST